MKIYARQWGNGLAVRIPKPLVEEIGLHANDELEITVIDGRIVLSAKKASRYSLHDLLRGISPDTRPDEWDTGRAIGHEAW